MKKFKILILGPVGVGKSSLVHRFINNQFSQTIPPTLAAAFLEKNYTCEDGQDIIFQFWDTAGQEKFRSIAKIYYKDARTAILMYDVNSKGSFEEMKIWMEQLKQKTSQDITLAILGNKIDLLKCQVSITEAEDYAKANNALFKEISVKENNGIEEIFCQIAAQMERSIQPVSLNNVRVSSANNPKKEKKKCP